MSKRGKQLLKAVLVVYLAGLVLFVYDVVQNRETAVLPGLVEGTMSVPDDPAGDEPLIAKRYRARRKLGPVARGQLVGRREIEALRAAGEKQLPVWDTAGVQRFAARKLAAGTDLKAGAELIVGAGEGLDEETVVRLIGSRDELVDGKGNRAVDERGRIAVTGRGAVIGVNLTMFFTWLNFIALVAGLYAFWDRMVAFLDGRAEAIRRDIESAETTREEADDLRRTQQEELAELRSRHDEIIREARAQGHAERDRIVAEAREHASARADQAEREIRSAENEARARLRGEIGGLAADLSSKILEREIGAKDHRKLIDEFVAGVDERAPEAEGRR